MIRYVTGNLLDAPCEALVAPVNTVGVMGKGLALQFKRRFPGHAEVYEKACKRGDVRVGEVLLCTCNYSPHRWIIDFPTKQHWRDPSRLEWIRDGLNDLSRKVALWEIRSVALPALGCGLGGLPWAEVKAAIEAEFADMPNVEVLVYEPQEKAR